MESITSDDILGKEVVDSKGYVLGIVQKIHIDKHTHVITGITIDEGFMKPDLFVGLDFVKNFGIDAIFLHPIPREKYIGLQVVNAEGKKIGKVIHTEMKKGKVQEFEIKTLFNKKILLPEEIKKIGTVIVLK
ncbi:MAG: PRC-barrel domain-containing protein [Candidatus Woesearchaeota archaeon]